MTIAFDAFTNMGNGTGTISATHTPVGTPKAVLILITQYLSDTDSVSAVTYGGVSLTLADKIQHVDGALGGEPSYTWIYFLGSGIPTGAQTAQFTVSGSAKKIGYCITYTASRDTEVQDTDKIQGDAIYHPSGTLALGGKSCAVAMVAMSGANNTGQVTELTGWTNRNEYDPGDCILLCYTYNTVGTSDVTWGTTQYGHDFCGVAIAVTETVPADFVPVIIFS